MAKIHLLKLPPIVSFPTSEDIRVLFERMMGERVEQAMAVFEKNLETFCSNSRSTFLCISLRPLRWVPGTPRGRGG